MARRRVIDWDKVSRFLKGRRWHEKLTFFGMLKAVDDFGLAAWSPLQIGQAFMEEELNGRKVSLKAIEEAMQSFASGEDPSLLTYSHNGQTFYAMAKHQDYQNVHSPGNANCPSPPREVFTKLSEKTRGLICQHFDKFTTNLYPEVEVEVEEEVEEEKYLRSAHKRLRDLYSSLFHDRTDEQPHMGNPDFATLKRLLKAEAKKDGADAAEKKVDHVIRHVMAGKYRPFSESIPPLATILSRYHWTKIVSACGLEAKADG